MQERGGVVGLEEHPAEEVPGAEEGPGEIGDENLDVVEVEDHYDPDEGQLHRGISTMGFFAPTVKYYECTCILNSTLTVRN